MAKKRKNPKKLKFKELDTSGIPLEEIYAVHKQFSPEMALALNLGDGFLCSTNPFFMNIRRELLRLGYSFSLDDPFHYFSFPLMCLDEVLHRQVIPYRNNAIWIDRLEKSAGKFFTLTELKRGELQFNYLFHESAHCIAHSMFFGKSNLEKIPKNQLSLLKILLGEAYANTSEALSALFIEGEIGSYFLDANCHFRTSEKEVKTLLLFARKVGVVALSRILLGSFLYSNYMYERLDRSEIRRVAEFAEVATDINILPVIKVGLTLSSQFRTTTTQLHLLKIGFGKSLNACIDMDPMEYLQGANRASLRKQVWALVDILVDGVEDKLS